VGRAQRAPPSLIRRSWWGSLRSTHPTPLRGLVHKARTYITKSGEAVKVRNGAKVDYTSILACERPPPACLAGESVSVATTR
jgi:hypothetical protein